MGVGCCVSWYVLVLSKEVILGIDLYAKMRTGYWFAAGAAGYWFAADAAG